MKPQNKRRKSVARYIFITCVLVYLSLFFGIINIGMFFWFFLGGWSLIFSLMASGGAAGLMGLLVALLFFSCKFKKHKDVKKK